MAIISGMAAGGMSASLEKFTREWTFHDFQARTIKTIDEPEAAP
jgi:hypothetical protein